MIQPYEQLLLEAGGGIIDTASLAPQPDCATIAIGLGGTGADALRRLKTKVYTRVRPDDPDAAEPAYSHIRFLAVDSDVVGMRHQGDYGYCHVGQDDALGRLDLQREFFDLSYSGSVSQLFKRRRVLLAKDPCFNEWLQFDEIRAEQADNGACGIRQLGRFLLFQRAGQFVETLKRLMTEARQGLPARAPLYVHILSGLCGGTGSGTFLDVCYLVRHAISQLGIGNATVVGYFFLPDVSLKPGFDAMVRRYLAANGYAAMQELDYCMGFEGNGDSWRQEYPGVGLVESRRQPVDLCCLVSGTKDGHTSRYGYDRALDVAAESALAFTTEVYVQQRMPSRFGMSQMSSQVASMLRDDKINARMGNASTGAVSDYFVLGAATCTVPRIEMLTYLAAGALRGLPELLERTPTEAEVTDFWQSAGLTYDQVYRRVTSHANMSFPMPDAKPKDARDNERLVIDWFTQMEHDTEGRIQANKETLAKPLGSYSAGEVADSRATELSLIAALLRRFREAMADPQRGPAWVARMVIGGGGYDVPAQLEGIRATAQGNLEQENFNLHEKPDNYFAVQKHKQAAFESAGFFKLNNAYNDWVGATKALVDSQARCAAFQAVIDLVDAVRPQVTKLSADFAGPFRDCVARLDATFQADAQYLDSFADGASRYETPIVTMAQVRPSLDEALRNVDGEAVERELLGRLLTDSGMSAWGPAGDDQKLTHLVSGFFLPELQQFSKRSITDYLEERYGTTSPGALPHRVCDDLLVRLAASEAPVFWKEGGYRTDQLWEHVLVTTPQGADSIQQAAIWLVQSMQTNVSSPDRIYDVCQGQDANRISVLRVMVGIPLWGYKGVDQFETATDQPGRHIYQPANRVEGIEPPASRDWNLLPSPMPWSVMRGLEEDHDKGAYERAEMASRLFDQALSEDIVFLSKPGPHLSYHGLPDDSLDVARREFRKGCEAVSSIDALDSRKAIQDVFDEWRQSSAAWKLAAPYGSSERECLDYYRDRFVRMPREQDAMRRELAKLDEIRGYIEKLAAYADLDDLCGGLFTGVVKFTDPEEPVTFVDEWGVVGMLAAPSMVRGGAPLYQSFLTYRGLSDDTKSEVGGRIRETVDFHETPEEDAKFRAAATNACRAVREELKYSGDRVALIAEAHPEEAKKCGEVLHVMSDRLDAFLMQNMLDL